ncbi:hypothetical protein E2C01_099630 [Portunus trituberculatus]|uniref:Uncharacterized protein n=1 Tax=Portunus trituberculatus TaxID=210409 RepID=A0A5B7KFF1_PORTR|nr:hypothetical protein [Portunus trituberculatus]
MVSLSCSLLSCIVPLAVGLRSLWERWGWTSWSKSNSPERVGGAEQQVPRVCLFLYNCPQEAVLPHLAEARAALLEGVPKASTELAPQLPVAALL